MLTALPLELLVAGGVPEVAAGRCLRGRSSRSGCARCAEACPKGAVELGAGPPSLASARCTGCSLCAAACPTGALGDPEELGRAIEALRARTAPVLGCRAPGVTAHARLSCLGALDAEALLALAIASPGGVTLNLVRCAGCAGADVLPRLREAAGSVARLPDLPAGRLRLAESEASLAVEEEALTRREFFSAFRRRSSSAAGAVLRASAPPPPEPYGAKRLPPGRRALLRVLPGASPELRAAAEGALFPRLEHGPGCRRCTACVGACPTGALRAAGEPPRPAFTAGACTACGLCAELCRRGAISLSRPAPPSRA